MDREDDGGPGGTAARAPLPPRLVGIAYLLAVLCVLVPLGVVIAVLVGAMVGGRNGWRTGAGVIAVAVISTALGVVPRL